jgi:hypothetical protein
MFDLRKDLKIHKSKKHSEASEILQSTMLKIRQTTNAGEQYEFAGTQKIQLVTDKYGYINEEIVLTPENPKVKRLAELLELSLVSRVSSEFFKANPTLSYNDLLAGSNVQFCLEKKKVDEALSRLSVEVRLNNLLFDRDSKLNQMLFKTRSGWYRSEKVEQREKAKIIAWLLYGVEIPASSKVEVATKALANLPIKDFGILDVDTLEHFLKDVSVVAKSILDGADPKKVADEIKSKIDSVLQSQGDGVPRRQKPRSELKKIYAELEGHSLQKSA